MKARVILRSLLIAYLLTGGCLLALAFILFKFNLGEGTAAAGIVLIYTAACLAGGLLAGKNIRKNRLQWGLLTGIFYYILLLGASFAVEGKWDMSLVHAVTTFFMCLGGGALGGMLS